MEPRRLRSRGNMALKNRVSRPRCWPGDISAYASSSSPAGSGLLEPVSARICNLDSYVVRFCRLLPWHRSSAAVRVSPKVVVVLPRQPLTSHNNCHILRTDNRRVEGSTDIYIAARWTTLLPCVDCGFPNSLPTPRRPRDGNDRHVPQAHGLYLAASSLACVHRPRFPDPCRQ